MTGEERKAWDRKVWGSLVNDCLNQPEHIYIPHRKSILAANAELKRLREAVDALQVNLRIFIHAHETGNSVPIFVVKDAEECCRRAKEG